MTTETETDAAVPPWLLHGVLDAIRGDASRNDPARAERYTGVDPDRVRRAIDRADEILGQHRCFGDDDVIDLVLARAALLVARALIRPLTGEPDGR